MKLAELLNQFDQIDKKGFYYSQIATSLRMIDEEDKQKPEYFYEWVAFMLTPQRGDKDWGDYYYGPHFSGTNDKGERVDTPSLSDITTDAVEYWELRIGQVKNPLLKMRYSDLVWDFKPSIVLGGKRDSSLYNCCIESMITVCDEDYCSHPVETVNVLERLFSITKSSPYDLQKTKAAYIRFEKKHADGKAVRCWASRFLLMLDNKRCFSDEERNSLVKEHEERLLRQSTPDNNGNIDPWLIEKQAKLLADFYKSGNHKEEIKRVLNISEKAFLMNMPSMDPLQRMGNMETVYHRYLHYGIKEEADRVLVELVKMGREAKESMQTHEIPFTIPPEVHEQFDLMFGKGAKSDEERWTNFSIYFIPRKDDEKEDLEELSKRYPFVYMMGTKVMDPKGRPMSTIGSLKSDPDGQLVFHVGKKLNLNSFAINIAIQDMIAVDCFTKEKIIDSFIKPSPLFDEQRYDIIGKAIDLYLSKDYITACHLLVPQIENAICNLVELCGETILKPQHGNEGFQLRTLDDLLRTNSVNEVFTEDGAFYFRLVLTDQRALNLRNLLCHGVLPPSFFGVGAADRLLHILVLLGQIRFVEKDKD